MSGLLGWFGIGSGALSAHNLGVAVAGRNVANVNTPGYSRQRVDLNAERSAPLLGGVSVDDIRRYRDDILSRRERLADGAMGRADTLSTALMGVEQEIMPPGNTTADAIATFFASLMDLSAAPMDPALRRQVVDRAGDVASVFQRTSGAITRAQTDADSRIATLVDEVNELSQEIADLNREVAVNPDNILMDKRDLAARKLAELTGGQARVDPDGHMRFTIGGGTNLVDGTRAATLEAVADAGLDNHYRIDLNDGTYTEDVTTKLSAGRLGGEIEFRDTVLATALDDLDDLAYDFLTAMNTAHNAAEDLSGTLGQDLFVDPGSASGAAASMAINSAIDADPDLLATAGAAEGPADNSGVLAMLTLRDDATVAGGGQRTFLDEAIRSMAAIGSAAADASRDRETESARSDMIKAARDSLSGVSLEEEMNSLMQYQHASEAARRFLSTLNELLDSLVNRL